MRRARHRVRHVRNVQRVRRPNVVPAAVALAAVLVVAAVVAWWLSRRTLTRDVSTAPPGFSTGAARATARAAPVVRRPGGHPCVAHDRPRTHRARLDGQPAAVDVVTLAEDAGQRLYVGDTAAWRCLGVAVQAGAGRAAATWFVYTASDTDGLFSRGATGETVAAAVRAIVGVGR